MKILLLALLTFFNTILFANETPEYKVSELPTQEGVFILANGYSATVIELKNGNFRYWFSSDVVLKNRPKYPLTGTYTFKENKVILNNDQVNQKEWTVRKINSTITLWRNDALEYYKTDKKLHAYGILRITKKTAEQAWEDKHH